MFLRRFSLNAVLWACAAGLAACVLPATVSGFDLEAGIRHEDNITRAERPDDIEHDTVLRFTGHQQFELGRSALDRVVAEVGLGADWHTRFEDLSRLSLDASVRYRHRFDTGFEAPWVETALSLVGFKHLDSELRDGGLGRAAITVGRRFGHQLAGRVGYNYQVRRTVEHRVFDLERHEAFGQLDWHLGTRWLLYGEIGAIEGEITSTAAIPNPRFGRRTNVAPRPDRAFGFGPSPLGVGQAERWTYQVDAVVLSGEVGVNYPLRRGLALDIAVRYFEANAPGDIEYDGYIVNGGLLWRFD